MIYRNGQTGEEIDVMELTGRLGLAVSQIFDGAEDITPWVAVPPDPLAAVRSEQVAAARVEFQRRVNLGAVVGSLHVAMDDGSRGNLQAVVLAAGLVEQGKATWGQQDGSGLPDFRDYARGWISMEGPRIPMDTPDAGLALALGVGAYYAALAQHEQDLENEVATSASPAAIDITAGWPSAA